MNIIDLPGGFIILADSRHYHRRYCEQTTESLHEFLTPPIFD
jgi:hypothetical protein